MQKRALIVLGCFFLWCLITGCGGGGGSISLDRSRASSVITLELQTSAVADFGAAEGITLEQQSVDGEVVCELVATGAQNLKGVFCELRFDPERYTPLQAESTWRLGGAEETLCLAAMQPGRLAFGQACLQPEAAEGFNGDGVLARMRFALSPYDERAAAGITCRTGSSSAPVSESSVSQAEWDGDTGSLIWDYASQGDFDQNGEVNAADLASLVVHFGESAAPDSFERQDVCSIVDGDGNGEINAADMASIVLCFGNRVDGYYIYASTDAGTDYPASADASSTIDPLGSVLHGSATGTRTSERLSFNYTPEGVVAGSQLWVRPYMDDAEGIASNLASMGGTGIVLDLTTEADDGAGTEADPYIVDTATEYYFTVTDAGGTDVSNNTLTAYTVSDDNAGSIDAATAMLDITDSFTGDFTVSAAYDGLAASPVLYFRVLSAANPIMAVQNDLSGNGVESDPYIVDTTTVIKFQLVSLLDGDVSGDAATIWTVSDSAAGSVVLGTPATLDITDGYTGTFTVGAAYDGAASIPSVFYLRVLAEGTPNLGLLEPPLNGSGEEYDPYEVDNATDYTLYLELDGSDVGSDTATVWTLSDETAGSIDVSSGFAVLSIADSFNGVFSVSAVYNGTASLPSALWLDGMPTGLSDPPVADLQVTPDTTTDDPWTEFTLDASGSTATTGSIDYYSWDYNGDGVWEIGQTTTNTLTHIFGTTGEYDVTVRVTDDRGAVDTASVTVTVTDNGNYYPTASLVVQADGDTEWYESLTAVVPVTINFDASASSDPDGAIDHYTWDLDGDGVFEYIDTSPQQSFTYTADGMHYPGVKAYDSAGDVDTAFVDLTLTQASGNMTPVAELVADPTYGEPPLSVSFDASDSSDPLGDQLSYAWDWDGDGTFDEDTGTTATATHEYSSSGDYTAVVKAYDTGGLFDTASVVITVDDGSGTWHFYDVMVPDGTDIESCGHYCSLAAVDGYPAIVFSADIPDDDYSPQKLMYVRAADVNGTSWDEPIAVHAPTDRWTEYGYAPEMEIVGGVPVVGYAARLYSSTYGWYYKIFACTASDAQGGDWGSAITVAGVNSSSASLHLDMAVVDGTAALAYYFSGDNTLQYRRATDTSGAAWDTAVTVDTFTFSGTPQTVDPSLAVVDGNPAVAYFFYMNDINADELHYTRATDATGSAWSSPLALSTTNGYGWYNTLLDNGSVPLLGTVDNSSDSHSILKFMSGADSAGASWEAAATVYDASGSGWFPPMVESAQMELINGMPCGAFFEESMSSVDLYFVRANDAAGSSWQGAQELEAGAAFSAYELSLAEVNNHPAIAFGGEVYDGSDYVTGLRYAVYY